VDDLPHFLLLLLILQRFNDAKWGYFTECSQSGLKVEPIDKLLTASFVADKGTDQKIKIVFYPNDHAIYLGTTLVGRGTSVIGGRKGPSPETTELGDTGKLREGNDLAVKIYWPEERRTSEVEILKRAKEYGRKIHFIGNHIPEVVCHRDPSFLCSSTKTIRQFLGLPTDGSRSLRVIVFGLLRPIKELKERDMLTAYLQCFFCTYHGRTDPNALLTDYDTGHYCLWKKGIQHGDVSLGNMMWDDRRKVGILNDFDLSKFADQKGQSGQDNTGTLPFMALDLLSEEGLRGEIPRLYRHEAESFAWSLICLCLSTVEGADGKNYTRDPHPLLKWFQDWSTSHDAKHGLQFRRHYKPGVPLVHQNTKPLAQALHEFWLDRYKTQFPRQLSGPKTAEYGQELMQVIGHKMSNPIKPPPYKELKDEEVFVSLLATHVESFPLVETTERGLAVEMSTAYVMFAWPDDEKDVLVS